MKRTIELVMVVCLMLAVLSACGKSTAKNTTQGTSAAPSTTAVPETDVVETIGEKQLNGLCEPLGALYTALADNPYKGMNYSAGKVENKDAVNYLDYLGAMYYSFDAQEYDQLQKGVKYVSFPEIDVTQLLDVVFGQHYTTADILTDNVNLIFNGHAYYVPVYDSPSAAVKYIGAADPLMTDTLNYSFEIDYHDGTVIDGKMKVKVAPSENNQYWMTVTSINATDVTVVSDAGQ